MPRAGDQPSSHIPGSRATDPARWNEQYGSYLFNYALRQVQDRQAAHDLVQETWLAALEARAGFAGSSSERTWLAGILRHKAIDYLRRRYRIRRLHRPYDPQSDEEASRDMVYRHARTRPTWMNPMSHLELKQLRTSLDRCLCRLSDRMRAVFTFCALEEMSHAEAAHRLGVTENHLYVLLHRTRRKIRRCLSI